MSHTTTNQEASGNKTLSSKLLLLEKAWTQLWTKPCASGSESDINTELDTATYPR